MKKTKSQEYFFAVLSSCESRILKLGTPLRCRVIKTTRKGRETYHVGGFGSDRFVIVKEPVFSEIRGVDKFAALCSKWRENLEFTFTPDKLKFTEQ